ncbi:hypothetical protein wVul_0300 [Wolbachia endosymbiont of Armadillidium vulgare str. wVulC]|nr:hypothetical protein wVul_0300 [Wolbachia endosymbiont of Armadillidium vulgare str. wVulC]
MLKLVAYRFAVGLSINHLASKNLPSMNINVKEMVAQIEKRKGGK